MIIKTTKFGLLAIVMAISSTLGVSAQNVSKTIYGDWQGKLNLSENYYLPIIIHITEASQGAINVTMDSPMQGAKDIPTDGASFTSNNLRFSNNNLHLEYNGKYNGSDSINGNFSQSGAKLPLIFTRIQSTKASNDQIPSNNKYTNTEVTITNPEAKGVTLSGTLSTPLGIKSYPAVILVPGSGPLDRDENIFGHKIFKEIADSLASNGIAVLRYDDRGVAKSTGDFINSTTSDFAGDALAVLRFLRTQKGVNPNKVGIIGHSEGGLIAQIIAAKNPEDVNFIVMLAAPGIPSKDILIKQVEQEAKNLGIPSRDMDKYLKASQNLYNTIDKKNVSIKEIEKAANNVKEIFCEVLPKNTPNREQIISQVKSQYIDNIMNNWFREFLSYNPKKYLERIKCRALALNGNKDKQVLSKENLSSIVISMKNGGNKNITTKEYKDLNHLFLPAKTGNPSEYSSIKANVSKETINDIISWIKTDKL